MYLYCNIVLVEFIVNEFLVAFHVELLFEGQRFQPCEQLDRQHTTYNIQLLKELKSIVATYWHLIQEG
jgi:hypothetical protein